MGRIVRWVRRWRCSSLSLRVLRPARGRLGVPSSGGEARGLTSWGVFATSTLCLRALSLASERLQLQVELHH